MDMVNKTQPMSVIEQRKVTVSTQNVVWVEIVTIVEIVKNRSLICGL